MGERGWRRFILTSPTTQKEKDQFYPLILQNRTIMGRFYSFGIKQRSALYWVWMLRPLAIRPLNNAWENQKNLCKPWHVAIDGANYFKPCFPWITFRFGIISFLVKDLELYPYLYYKDFMMFKSNMLSGFSTFEEIKNHLIFQSNKN